MKTIDSSDAFPLLWPEGWPATPSHKRTRARYTVTYERAIRHLVDELRRMGARGVVISTNVPIRRDGLPYSDFAKRRIDNPGVAVYFTRKGDGGQQVIACDKYVRVEENVRACGLTIEALRAIERAGASELLDRAFQGFKALPAAGEGTSASWWNVLGVHPQADLATAQRAYRDLARQHHPDAGGDAGTMAMINRAWEQAQAATQQSNFTRKVS